jgi:cyanophycinase
VTALPRISVLPLLLAVALAGAALLPRNAAAQEPGRLVIVGGGLARESEEVFRAVLDARHGSGPLCIIPTASGDTDAAIRSSIERFGGYGGHGTAVGVPITLASPDAAQDSAVVARIRGCSGFWFTGGVQSRTVRVFRPDGRSTPAYEALLQRHREGAVVAGSSAGAAVMSDPMIAGGSTTGAIRFGARRDPVEQDEDENEDYAGGGVSITTGLGFLGSAIVDQHFLARGRIGRLVAAVLDVPEFDLGFGVDENTALVIDGDIAYTLGESGVNRSLGQESEHRNRGQFSATVRAWPTPRLPWWRSALKTRA